MDVSVSPTPANRMNAEPPPASRLWAIVPLAVVALITWFHAASIERVEAVSGQFSDNLILTPDEASPSGYAEGRRGHLVPGHNLESYEWIVQAENIRSTGNWRIREVDYDNAPNGRTVQSPSAARWWLAAVTPILGDGATPGAAVADASLKSEPLLHAILVVGVSVFVTWQWGFLAGAVASILVGLGYPVVGAFQAGAPSARGLVTLALATACLSFLAGLRGRSAKRWWIMTGIALGTAIWISPTHGYPLALGLFVAGLAAHALAKRSAGTKETAASPWWLWGLSGGLTALAFYAVDFLGTEITWGKNRLHQIHPLHGVSLVGLGWLGALIQRGEWNRPRWIQGIVALLVAGSLGGMMVAQKDAGFTAGRLGSDLLTHLPDTVSAASFAEWVNAQESKTAPAAIFLPFALIGFAVWQLLQGKLRAQTRGALLAAVLITVGMAALGLSNLSWWGPVFCGLAGVAALSATALGSRRAQAGLAAAVLVAAGVAWADLGPRIGEAADPVLTAADVRSLAERDLAHWLSLRDEEYRSVVLSPPDVTPALYFYGGVPGLGSPYAENQDGFIAAVRIASASSPDESLALATQREISHIVIPSWDPFLYEYAQLGAAQPEHSMMAMLDQWLAPRWMRPVQHQLPQAKIFEDFSSVIFQVTETQDNASALSRLGEYFAETGRAQFAAAIAVTLQDSFPSDLSGLVAQAQIAVTQGNLPVFNEALAAIIPYVEEERDGDLEFDRRVSLANVLMLGREAEYAREQVGYCMDEMDDYLLTTVTAPNLYRFMLLAQSFNEPFPEPELAELARQLLPQHLRAEL